MIEEVFTALSRKSKSKIFSFTPDFHVKSLLFIAVVVPDIISVPGSIISFVAKVPDSPSLSSYFFTSELMILFQLSRVFKSLIFSLYPVIDSIFPVESTLIE